MLPVMFMDKDDPNPGMPWASRLEVAGAKLSLAWPIRISGKGRVARPRTSASQASSRDPVAQFAMVVFPCKQRGMPF